MSTSRYQRNAPTVGGSADVKATNRQDGYVLAWSNAEESHIYTPQGADPSIDARITTLEETYVRNTRFATVTTTTGTVTLPEGAAVILNDFGGDIDCDIQRIEAGRPNGEAAFDTDGLVIVSSFDTDGNFVLSGTPADASVALVYRVRQEFLDYDDTDADIIGVPFKEMPEYYRINLTAADSPYSPPSIKNTIYAVDLTDGDVVINLPEVSEIIEGDSCYIYIERISGANELTINTFGTQTIRGSTSQVLKVLRDGINLVAHTFLANHWDALDWSRTDEIVYNPGNAGTTTIKTLQGLLDFSLSSGQVSGCVVSSNGDGTIAVTAGEWKLRVADTTTSDCRVYAVPAAASLTPTDNATSYLVVNYNGGSPSWTIEASVTTIACQSKCVQAVLYRRGNSVHWMYLGAYSTDFMGSYAKAESVTAWLKYGSGLQVSSPTGLTIASTAGALYQGTLRFAIDAFNTNTGSTVDLWYRDGSGGWTVVADQTTLPNTQFDDGDGTRADIPNGRRANWWLFVLVDNPSKLVAVYPQNTYANDADAIAEAIPAVLPPFAAQFSIGKLIAKVRVRRGNANIQNIASPFTTQFTTSSPTDHNELSNLQGGTADQYYHLTQAQATIATQAASATVAGYVDTGAQTLAGAKTLSTALVINEDGNDADTRIEGDTDANLIYVDASTDKVGIGTATPSEKLEVAGNIALDSSTSVSISFETSGTSKGLLGIVANSNDGVTGSAVGDMFARVNSKAIRFSCDNGTSSDLTVEASGITVTGTSTVRTGGTAAFTVEKANGDDVFSVDTTNGKAVVTGNLEVSGGLTASGLFKIGVSYGFGDYTGVQGIKAQASMLVLLSGSDVNGAGISALYLVNLRVASGNASTSATKIAGDAAVTATFTYVANNILRVTYTGSGLVTTWRYLGGF